MSERVELDRLADYAAGLLDGTPDAAEVAHLIATDEAWAATYADLVAADDRVRCELAALGAAAEPMPAEVLTRLETAVHRAAPGGGPGLAGRGRVVPLDAARRRRRRWAATLAAAAAGLVAFGVFGLPALRTQLDDGDVQFATSAGENAKRAEAGSDKASPLAAPAVPSSAGLLVQASGVEYRRETLRVETTGVLGESLGSSSLKGTGGAGTSASVVPDQLRRLADPAARDACLAVVTAQYGDRPVSVDYARFEGVPALIVRLVDAGSRPSRVVVAGAGCGLSGSGADVRYTVTAG